MANNYSAVTDPTSTNGASVGDFWLNTTKGRMFQCRDATAGSTRWINTNPVVNVKDFGATGDGITDDTTTVNAAMAACPNGGTLYFPTGIYRINLTITTPLNLAGDGPMATKLCSANDNAFAVVYAGPGTAPGNVTDLAFFSEGNDNRGGVQLGASTYSEGQDGNGNHSFTRVNFTGCSVGVYKVYGQVYNEFNWCVFQCTKYCVYAWNATVIPAPPAPTTTGTTTGGTSGARTCYAMTTYVSAAHGETSASPETTQTLAANHRLGIASPPAPTAGEACIGWNAYATDFATGTESKQNSTPIAIGTAWTEPTTGLGPTGDPPSANFTGQIIHAGCDYYTNCWFGSTHAAAVYYDSNYEGGQVTFRTCIFENNHGFGVYINTFGMPNEPGLTFENVWWEDNATETAAISTTGPFSTDVTNYTPVELFAQNCKSIVVRDGMVPKTSLGKNCSLLLEHTSNANTITKDASSVVVATNGVPAQLQQNELYFDSVLYGLARGNSAPVVSTKPRSVLTHKYGSELIYSNTFSKRDSESIAVGSQTTNIVADGTLFDSCQELVMSANNGGNGDVVVSGIFNMPLGKHYVWTLDLKVMSEHPPLQIIIGYNVSIGAISDFTGNGNGARWYSYACLTSAPVAAGFDQSCGLRVVPGTNASTVRFGPFQVLAFDRVQDATEFLLSGAFAVNANSDRPRIFYSDQAPSTGTWQVGDTVYKVAPSAGGYMGWVCVTAGSPGTWKTFGPVTA